MKRKTSTKTEAKKNVRVSVDIDRELLKSVEKAGAFYGFDRAKAIRFFLRNAVALRSTTGGAE